MLNVLDGTINNFKSPKYNRKLYKYIRDNNLDFNNLTFKILKDNIETEELAKKYETTFIIFYNSIDNGCNHIYSAFTYIRNKGIFKKYQKEYQKTDKFKHKKNIGF